MANTQPAWTIDERWVLGRELELVRNGKAKTPEERANARQLSEFVEPSQFGLAA